jgi:hypothetical protein
MNQIEASANQHRTQARAGVHGGMLDPARLIGRWTVRCRRGGKVIWEDEIKNAVVDTGLNYLLGASLTRETQINTWHVGVTSGTPTVAQGDTHASHSGWAELEEYTETERPVWIGSRSSNLTATNPTAVTFTVNTGVTIGGAFLASVNSKGTTGAATLYAVGALAGGNRVLNSGDTLDITATFTNTIA